MVIIEIVYHQIIVHVITGINNIVFDLVIQSSFNQIDRYNKYFAGKLDWANKNIYKPLLIVVYKIMNA